MTIDVTEWSDMVIRLRRDGIREFVEIQQRACELTIVAATSSGSTSMASIEGKSASAANRRTKATCVALSPYRSLGVSESE